MDILNNIAAVANAAFDIRDGDYKGDDGLWYCGKCNAPRQTRGEGPLEGRILAAACRCEELVAAEVEQKKAIKKLQTDAAKTRFFERGYERFTFSADDGTDAEAGKTCRGYVEKFAEMEVNNFGLFMSGPVGTGKSFFAGAIVNALIDSGISALICTSGRVISELRAAERNGKLTEAVDEINGFRFLVLDDFGAEFEDSEGRVRDYNIQLLERLINERVLSGRPLCITTNTSRKSMLDENRQVLKRIYDRVIELCCLPVILDGRNRRTKNAEERRAACVKILEA